MSRRTTIRAKSDRDEVLVQFAELIAELHDNPIAFVIVVLGAKPDPWQRKALKALVDEPRKWFAIRAGHGVGKTAFEAWVILWFLMTRSFPKVIATAPSRQQLVDILWSELWKWMSTSDILKRMFEWQKTRIVMSQEKERWWASARTANRPENFAGIHEENVLMLFDEASGVKDDIYEVADGALTTPGAFKIMCGNPTRTSGEFYDAFHSKSRLYWTIRVSCLESPRVTSDYIENLRIKYGEGSNQWRVRVEGNFPKQEDDILIPLEFAEAATMRDVVEYRDKLDADGNIIEAGHPLYLGALHMGVDPARFGGDEIVYYYRVGPHVFYPEIHKDQETTVTAGQVIALGRELLERFHRPQIIIKIDVGGLGAGVFDMVVEQAQNEPGEWIIIPIDFGGKVKGSSDEDKLANFASQMWMRARDMLRDEEIHLPDDKVTIDQLSTRKHRIDSKGRTMIEPKPDYKKRHKESPDRADALVMCLWDGGGETGIRDNVTTTSSPASRPATQGLRKKRF